MYQTRGEVPDGDIIVPIGTSIMQREGKHVTIVTYSKMLELSIKAADLLAKDGIEVEIIDLRSLRPLDMGPVIDLVKKNKQGNCGRRRLEIIWCWIRSCFTDL